MRRRYEERKKEPIRARDILSNLSSARPALIKLKGQGKDYDPLIDVIVRIGEEDPIPASKDLQVEFSIKPAKLKKWIDDLYEDFLNTIRVDASVLNYNNLEHHICIYGYRSFVSFSCKLPVVPRIGEELSIPFISAYASGSGGSYYVYDVRYTLINSTVTVEIWARQGSYNKHFEYLKDRAEFEGNLNRLERLDKPEYEIEKELRSIYK